MIIVSIVGGIKVNNEDKVGEKKLKDYELCEYWNKGEIEGFWGSWLMDVGIFLLSEFFMEEGKGRLRQILPICRYNISI